MPGPRLRRPPGSLALGLALVIGIAGTIGMKVSADKQTGNVTRDEAVVQQLEKPANDAPAENYLLVGSDSRAGISADDPNAGAIGSTDEVTNSRSDTIMVLRRERNGGASILSLPRDLWVPIAGTDGSSKINAAYNGGSQRLVATISQSLGIPINHYVEIDFAGFQKLVDEIGGVEVCTYVPAQDTHSGLRLDPGCTNVDGSQALAFARSRHYQEWRDGKWHEDGTADLGRIKRQQLFINNAVKKLLSEMESDPFQVGQLIGVATAAVTIDQGLDPVTAAAALRQAAQNGLNMYSLPVVAAEHKGQSALDMNTTEAQPILDYFRGNSATPPPTTPTTPSPPPATD
jgi:LCP family protein required for cell wall assembly